MHRALWSFNDQSGGSPLGPFQYHSFSPYLNWGNSQLDTFFQVLPMMFQVEWTKHTPLSAGFYLTGAAQVCLLCCPSTLLINFHFPVHRGISACISFGNYCPLQYFPFTIVKHHKIISIPIFQPLAVSPCSGLSLQCICLSSQSNAVCNLSQEAYNPVIQIFYKDLE